MIAIDIHQGTFSLMERNFLHIKTYVDMGFISCPREIDIRLTVAQDLPGSQVLFFA